MYLPDKKLLSKTSEIDYYQWNYQFPIKYIQRIRFKAITNLLGNKIYERILEIGTGSGIFLPELANHCNELYAIDVHDRWDAIKVLCGRSSSNVNLARCSIQNTGFDSNSFDAIVTVSVLEFIDDLDKAFNEIKRVLKKNGYFIAICAQYNPLTNFFLGFYSRIDPEKEFKQSPERVSSMIKKHFNVFAKNSLPPIIGSFFPLYYCYKLKK